MVREHFSRVKGFYIAVVIMALLITHPLDPFAQRRHQEKLLKVEVNGDLVTMDVRNTEVSEVLKEIEKGSGIKITISPELQGQSIYFLKFTDLSIEKTLRLIWNEFNSYCIYTLVQDPANKDKQIIKEIKAYGDIIGTKPYKGKITTIEISYGEGENEVGLISPSEGLPTGPGSFAVDEAGNIYICDTVEARVQVFSPTGAHLYGIPLEEKGFYKSATSRIYYGPSPIDIAVDRYGFIYIRDNSNSLYQYDKQGNVINSIQMDATPWSIFGNLEIINDEIYIGVCEKNRCGYMFCIARIAPDRSLVGLTDKKKQNQNPKEKRRGFTSGRKMQRKSEKLRQEFSIEEKDSATSKVLSFSQRVITYMEVMGEDGKGNLYIKTNRGEINDKVTEIQKFSAEGEYLATFQTPKGVINSGAIKYYLITKGGTIYHFLSEEDKLRITIFYAVGT